MTFHTVRELTNAFLLMLASDVFDRVLMTPVAGVNLVGSCRVAGHTARVMVTVEYKVFVVIKRCRLPRLCGVTTHAVALELAVQLIGWRLVAAFATIQHTFREQRVFKRRWFPSRRTVTLTAVRRQVPVQAIGRRRVTALTAFA